VLGSRTEEFVGFWAENGTLLFYLRKSDYAAPLV
jgi:hypothetical protein